MGLESTLARKREGDTQTHQPKDEGRGLTPTAKSERRLASPTHPPIITAHHPAGAASKQQQQQRRRPSISHLALCCLASSVSVRHSQAQQQRLWECGRKKEKKGKKEGKEKKEREKERKGEKRKKKLKATPPTLPSDTFLTCYAEREQIRLPYRYCNSTHHPPTPFSPLQLRKAS